MSEDARRQRAASIFQSLLEQPREERDAALAAACGADGALEAMVKSLLAMDAQLYSSSDDIQLSALLPNQQLKVPALIQAGQPIGRHIARHRLGLGGMAEVWAVQHEVLGTWHALKVLLWASEPLKQRLLLEGRTQARLVHDNILPVRDILDLSGTPALLMPLVEGPSLEALLKQHSLSTNDALAIFHGILAGIGHAHSAGVIHRDIKPGNILIALRQGRLVPLVADFGLVKDGSSVSLTATGVRMGTPAYAAPEQLFDASTADARADLFALGVLLTEMLAGHRPFSGGSIEQILDAHRHPPDLTGTPEALKPLLRGLLQPDPEQRTQSVAEVLASLPPAQPISGTLLSAAHALLKSPQPSTTTTQRSGTPLPPHNLPRARDRFIGRVPEQRTLRDWLESSGRGRLLTVTGPGGTGKTRLCQELGRAVLADWPGGVWWVDLSEVTDLTALLTAVSRALKKNLQSATPDAVGKQLSGLGRSLVFLDNFEQIVDLGAATVGRWLESAPEVVFVVTSRSPLRLRGEKLYPVEPLDVSHGAQLFVERAQAMNPSFSLTDETRAEVEELITLLDGLPLAIELAAARARTMTPARLLKRLSRRFDLLTSRSPELPARQRTLRATLQWSWDLLSPIEKATLAQSSVFHGGFTIEAAEDVIDLSAFDDDPWVEDVLAALVDRSLLRSTTDRRSGEMRLSMLVSVQAFATEKLTEREPIELRHGAYYAGFGSDVFAEQPNGRLVQAREMGNLEVAVRRALARGDRHVATHTIFAILQVTFRSGPIEPGAGLAEDTLTMWQGDRHLKKARLMWMLGGMREINGSEESALHLYRTAIADCQVLGEAANETLIMAHINAGYLLSRLTRFDEAEVHFAVAINKLPDNPTTREDKGLLSRVLVNQANLFRRSGRFEASLPLYQKTLEIVRELGITAHISVTLNNMAIAYRHLGQWTVARGLLIEALGLARQTQAPRVEISVLGNLADVELDPEQKLQWHQDAFRLAEEMGAVRDQLNALTFLALAYQSLGRLDDAQKALEHSSALSLEHGQRTLRAQIIQLTASQIYLTQPTDRARQEIQELLDTFPEDGDPQRFGNLQYTLSLVEVQDGRPEVALPLLEKAVSRLAISPNHLCRARILLWRVRRTLGQSADEVAEAIEETLRSYKGDMIPHKLSWQAAQVVVARMEGDAEAEARARAEIAALLAATPHPIPYRVQRQLDALPV